MGKHATPEILADFNRRDTETMSRRPRQCPYCKTTHPIGGAKEGGNTR